jgi:hypothetical protein
MKKSNPKSKAIIPCREFELTIANKDIPIVTADNNLYAVGILLINKMVTEIITKTAIRADAKFGFPAVDIMGLYGLFQLTKSLSKCWRTPYPLKIDPTIAPALKILNMFVKLITLKEYRKIIINEKYARKPLRRWVSPITATILLSAKTIDTSIPIIKSKQNKKTKNSFDRSLTGFLLSSLSKWPISQVAVTIRTINFGVLNGSFAFKLKYKVTKLMPQIIHHTELEFLD